MRAFSNVAQRRGKLVKHHCYFCYAAEAEKHHPDYSMPLLVVWLCRDCHLDVHANEVSQAEDYVKVMAHHWDMKRKLMKQNRQMHKDGIAKILRARLAESEDIARKGKNAA